MSKSDAYRYLSYDENDRAYFGCSKVIQAEWEYIHERRRNQGLERALRAPGQPGATLEPAPPPDLCGIALSGGGIRSASYCLGVLQALAFSGWLKNLDYLSTVSGGGYIGGAMTWFLHRMWKGPADNEIAFGVDRATFPFGTYPMVSMREDETPVISDANVKGRLLANLRQHVNYLLPGDGVNLFSLVAVVLRNTLFSLFVYGGLLALFFVFATPVLYDRALTQAGYQLLRTQVTWLPHVESVDITVAQALFVLLPLLFAAAVAIYAIIIVVRRRKVSTGYSLRRFYERWMGYLVFLFVGVLVVNAVSYVDSWIDVFLRTHSLQSSAKELKTAFGAFSTIFGGLSAMWAFFAAGKEKPKVPIAVPVALASLATIFGLLLLAHSAASGWTPAKLWHAIFHASSIIWPLGAALLVFCAGFANLNYLSIHRYYRDRLMETFLPDLPDAVNVNGAVAGAPKSADSTELNKMCGAQKPRWLGPYPILNTNIVLVSSHIPKFRGRGGDSFILTPKYCGSNATGWCETLGKDSPFEDLTLATAIAISGAAINSNTGSGGEGLTRSPWLSFLMGLFSIRLGYWAPNPTPDRERLQRIAYDLDREIQLARGTAVVRLWPLRYMRMAAYRVLGLLFWRVRGPKPIYPGLSELFFRKNLDENSRFVQLSDGGHFENLGLYELIRRKLRLIIVCDATADPHFAFDDLANALEKIRADFGALIDLRADGLRPIIPVDRGGAGAMEEHAAAFSRRAYVTAKITYNDNSTGTLLYLNSTLFETVSADLYGYRKAHGSFPDQPTSDQFFDERQFEAYRELGYQTAYKMMFDADVTDLPDVQATLGRPNIERRSYFGEHLSHRTKTRQH